jgi:hypothetical protein
LQSLVAVRRFAHDLNIREYLQPLAQDTSRDWLVIDYQSFHP